MTQPVPVRKVVLVGNACTGKSQSVNLLNTPTPAVYTPTLGVEVTPYGNLNGYVCNIWDTAGDPRFYGAVAQYYNNADLFIYYGSTSATSTKSYNDYVNDIRLVSQAPIICINNPIDLKNILDTIA